MQYVPRFIRPGARYPNAVLDTLRFRDGKRETLARLLDLPLPDSSTELRVVAEAFDGRERVFTPPWTVAEQAASAVISAAVAEFCGAFTGGCVSEVTEQTYRRALLRSGSAVGGGVAAPGAANASGVGGISGVSAVSGVSGGVRYDSMPVVPITVHHGSGSSVVQMPAMIFGTAGRSAEEVRAALKAGWRHLDLAEMYGNEVGLESQMSAKRAVQHYDCLYATNICNLIQYKISFYDKTCTLVKIPHQRKPLVHALTHARVHLHIHPPTSLSTH